MLLNVQSLTAIAASLAYPFQIIYSYMKYTNKPSVKTAISYGCKQVDEYKDDENEITKVFAISKDQWADLIRQL